MPPDQPTGAPEPEHAFGPDAEWLDTWCRAAARRWRLLAGLYALAVAAAVGLMVHAVLMAHTRAAGVVAVIAGGVAAVLHGLATRRVWHRRTMLLEVERAHPDLRNALLAWHEAGRDLGPAMADRLAAQARRPLVGAGWPRPYGRRAWAVVLAGLVTGLALHLLAPHAPSSGAAVRVDSAAAGPDTAPPAVLDWLVIVTPPAYTRLAPARSSRPTRVEALAGSRVEFRFTSWEPETTAQFGAASVPVSGGGAERVATLTPAASDVLLVRNARGQVLASIAVVVRRDAAPRVRIVAPAADLRRATATGIVPIRIAAHDDLGLRDLRLRFTKVSGSGESFTFVDGEWPVQVTRPTAVTWDATYALDLAVLGLAPGDSVVYHAVAHDARVGLEGAAESERFLIEIPRPGAAAGGDFSLPEPEDKFALSQRMVIQMTERLLERRARLTVDDYREQAQGLAMAQRRVRAEFVFMLGGEVEDEFEEAAHSHEVEAGRLDNRGQSDLTEAVRQMSQAERRLTDADLREALPYEYKALAAVQAAFGKARYFMRTLPVPVRLDAARRLQGDRGAASSSRWARTPIADQQRAAAIDVLRRLEALADDDRAALAAVLPALIAVDRGDAEWVALAQRAVHADGAVDVTRALRARLIATSAAWVPVALPRTPLESRGAAARRGGQP